MRFAKLLEGQKYGKSRAYEAYGNSFFPYIYIKKVLC